MAKKRPKKRTLLSWVGLWATIWWAVSCGYVALVVWQAKNLYVSYAMPWGRALKESFNFYPYLWSLLVLIIIVWIVGAVVWVKALKQSNISLKSGLKDLFLIIR